MPPMYSIQERERRAELRRLDNLDAAQDRPNDTRCPCCRYWFGNHTEAMLATCKGEYEA
jgi:hypothetical protein